MKAKKKKLGKKKPSPYHGAAKRKSSRPKLRATPKLRKPLSRAARQPLDAPMDAAGYLAALKALGLGTASQRTARALGHNIRQCQRFAHEEAIIPASVARLLRMYLRFGLPLDAHAQQS